MGDTNKPNEPPHLAQGRLLVTEWAVECPGCLAAIPVEKVWDDADGVFRQQEEDTAVFCEDCGFTIMAKGVCIIEES